MKRLDIHDTFDFFQYVRLTDSVPEAEANTIDVAILDMNHSWPNVGHDSVVHALLEIADGLAPQLRSSGQRMRVLSFDIRRQMLVPEARGGRFGLFVGTGGPGHLDPRENDGVKEFSQGINESTAWEAPLFQLFDDVMKSENAGLFAICHSFGLMCRWSGIAHPELRAEKSSGMPENSLAPVAQQHPWFSRFAGELGDNQTFRVVDNRLFDLVWDGGAQPIAFETPGSNVLTMVEFARHDDGMPRVFGVNHHPEIVDREHIMLVLEEKRAHGEVSDSWYRERAVTMRELFQGENERQSRLTSKYTLIEPLRAHVTRLVHERTGVHV